jgi:hypothetical protein
MSKILHKNLRLCIKYYSFPQFHVLRSVGNGRNFFSEHSHEALV